MESSGPGQLNCTVNMTGADGAIKQDQKPNSACCRKLWAVVGVGTQSRSALAQPPCKDLCLKCSLLNCTKLHRSVCYKKLMLPQYSHTSKTVYVGSKSIYLKTSKQGPSVKQSLYKYGIIHRIYIQRGKRLLAGLRGGRSQMQKAMRGVID